jgi:hypothetical protein
MRTVVMPLHSRFPADYLDEAEVPGALIGMIGEERERRSTKGTRLFLYRIIAASDYPPVTSR